VVSPAPDYDIHEVGVPEMIAQYLTFPERVTSFNMAELTVRVRNGPDKLLGAVAVIMPDGSSVDLTLCEEREMVELQEGWIVERYMRNGDWVLFNRQPSLHRMSIMAHQVRIIKDKTFRLPICDTTPYNADFDGDESK
jgi:DNA-directed RNA polymerase beta' subunit